MIPVFLLLLILPQDGIGRADFSNVMTPIVNQVKCLLNLVNVDSSPTLNDPNKQLTFHIWKMIDAGANRYVPLTFGNNTQLKENFGERKTNVGLFFHDIGGHSQEKWILDSKDYYLKESIEYFSEYFAISFDYKEFAQEKSQAVRNVVPIAKSAASVILWMAEELPPDFIRLVDIIGLGIGSNIAAKTLEILRIQDNNYFPYAFNALDPVQASTDALKLLPVCSNEENSLPKIENVKVKHILVLHTSTCSYSPLIPACNSSLDVTMGTIDYFANGGAEQPGCGTYDWTCKRKRAAELFVETLLEVVGRRGPVLCSPCTNYEAFNKGNCNCHACHPMQFFFIDIPPGKYFLNTSASPPYA